MERGGDLLGALLTAKWTLSRKRLVVRFDDYAAKWNADQRSQGHLPGPDPIGSGLTGLSGAWGIDHRLAHSVRPCGCHGLVRVAPAITDRQFHRRAVHGIIL
jgi:hypothetical protein